MVGVRPWLVAALWICWCLVAAGAGYAQPAPGDRIDARGTRISVWADVVTVVAMGAAVAAALVLPAAALPTTPWLSVALGAALVLLGLALRLWAARTLGLFFTRSVLVRDGHRVVSTGPYRWVRHPGYAGMLVSLCGLALTLDNWLSIVLMVLGFFVAHVPRINAEEAMLEAHLGEEYRAFARTHKRLIPGVW
jgi:protein-S-isoprenylcysteine O-methyltransferase Ste14